MVNLNIWEVVSDDLEVVKSVIATAVDSNNEPQVRATARHIVESGGKYLRPCLALFINRIYDDEPAATGKKQKQPQSEAATGSDFEAAAAVVADGEAEDAAGAGAALPNPGPIHHLAAAIETLHIATLLHDDVIDGSTMRRGKVVANLLWGNKQSVLVGDFLFGLAFKLLIQTGSLPVLDRIARASVNIATAEVKQLNLLIESQDKIAGNLACNKTVSVDTYIEMIEGKTAELFAATCETAAITAGQEEDSETWREFGLNFGIVFQIIDDLIDYTSRSVISGKDEMLDVRDGKITLPLILLLERVTPSERAVINRVFEENILYRSTASSNGEGGSSGGVKNNRPEKERPELLILKKMFDKYEIEKTTKLHAIEYTHIALGSLRRLQEKYSAPQRHKRITSLAELMMEMLKTDDG